MATTITSAKCSLSPPSQNSRCAMYNAPITVAWSTSESPATTVSTEARPLVSASAMRSCSRRRTCRIARMASSGSGWRCSCVRISLTSSSRVRGRSWGSSPSHAIECGEVSSRSETYRELDRIWHNRSAAALESRNNRRNHGVLPMASEIFRKLSRPASGSTPCAIQSSSTGSRVRRISARRLTPLERASM